GVGRAAMDCFRARGKSPEILGIEGWVIFSKDHQRDFDFPWRYGLVKLDGTDRDGLLDLGRRLRHLYAQLPGRLRVNCSLLYRAGTSLVIALLLASLGRRRLAHHPASFERALLVAEP